ncbi:MAG: hypothetical protein KatS3mg111_2075 [Pirellulaceae bacterium]|nr:MAG: hypothetical protein KatS3mg111_2075 [Pirellulaceae bacterium]
MNNRRKSIFRSARLSRSIAILLLCLATTASVTLYLLQDSLFGLRGEDGAVYPRVVDFLIMPTLFSSMWGDGVRPVGIADRIPILAFTTGWFVLAWRLGRPFVDWIGRQPSGRDPHSGRTHRLMGVLRGGLATLVGLALISTAVLLLGLAGLLSTRLPLAWALLSGWLIVEVWGRGRRCARDVGRQVAPTKAPTTGRAGRLNSSSGAAAGHHLPGPIFGSPGDEDLDIASPPVLWMRRLLPVTVVGLAVVYLWGAMLPPWEFDVLEYHLQAPKEFALGGKIEFVPHNVYANMPLGAEMHALGAMVLLGGADGWWWGGIIGKTILGGVSVLLMAVVGSWAAVHAGRVAGWSAAGICLGSIGHAHVATAGLIDMVMAAYLFASVIVVQLVLFPSSCHKVASGLGDADGLYVPMMAMGVFSGAAASCKYPGVVLAMLPVGGLVLVTRCLRIHRDQAPRIQWTAVAGLLVGWCATAGPWFAKNWLLAGNPIYPLLGRWLGAKGLDPEAMARWDQVHSPWANSAHPFGMEAAWDGVLQLFVRSPYLNPLVISLAFLGCIVLFWLFTGHSPRQAHAWRWEFLALGAWAWLLVVWWVGTHRIDRFWLPALPFIALHGAAAAQWTAARLSTVLALSLVLAANILALCQICAGAGPVYNEFFVQLRVLEEEEWRPTRSLRVDPATAWINAHLDGDDLLLSIGHAKAYLYRVPLMYATCFNPVPGREWLEGRKPASQWQSLREHGVTHVLIDWAEIERYRSPGNYGFASWPQPADVEQLIDRGVLTRLRTPFDPRVVDILAVASHPPNDDR